MFQTVRPFPPLAISLQPFQALETREQNAPEVETCFAPPCFPQCARVFEAELHLGAYGWSIKGRGVVPPRPALGRSGARAGPRGLVRH